MPAVDAADAAQVLLERPDRIAVSPDGHGGMLAALDRSGALDDIQRRGIEHCSTSRSTIRWSISAGPSSSATTCLAESEMSSQVVAKRDPLERVGNVVQVDGRLMVIEYSDLPDDAGPAAQCRRLAGDLGRQHRGPRVRRGAAAAHGRVGRRPCRSTSRARKWPTSIAAGRRVEPKAAQRDQVRAVHLRPDARRPPMRSWSRSIRPRDSRPLKNAARRGGRHARSGPGPDGRAASPLASAGRRQGGRRRRRSKSARSGARCRGSCPEDRAGAAHHAADVFCRRVTHRDDYRFQIRATVVPLRRRIRRRISSTLSVESTADTGRPVSATIWSIGVASLPMAESTCCSNSFSSSSAG